MFYYHIRSKRVLSSKVDIRSDGTYVAMATIICESRAVATRATALLCRARVKRELAKPRPRT